MPRISGSNSVENIQTSLDTENAKGMYKGLIMAAGPLVMKTGPLKSVTSVILHRVKKMYHMVKLYFKLYSTKM